tara:strand:- start:243 stop:521 length:279 start_codon:yes stop_codon:yes gene_type:complete
MRKRKTVEVAELRETLNAMLENVGQIETHPNRYTNRDENGLETPKTPADFYRMGIINVLESVLHGTGNYHGFGYDTKKNSPLASTPMKRYYY